MLGIFEILGELKDFFFATDGVSFWQRLQAWGIITWLKIQIMFIKYASGIALAIMDQLGISGLIAQAFSGVGGNIVQMFAALKVPDCVNLLVQAYITRFVLGFMGR